jgi:hypothetical protein
MIVVERERVGLGRGGTLERVLVAFRGGERILHPVVIMEWDQTKGGHAMRLGGKWMQQVKRETRR